MNLREIVGSNLTYLRKKENLTQLELANKLNYSDKSVSKWEHGDALPSVEDLILICQYFNITLDQLTSNDIEKCSKKKKDTDFSNKIVITLLSVFGVWLISTSVFVGLSILDNMYYWQSFLYAVPLSSIVLLVFNSIWGNTRYNHYIISVLIWSIITSIYCSVGGYQLWIMYLVGIPAQIIVIIWSRWNTTPRMLDKYKKQ